MAAISIILTLVSLFTFWLVVPMFVLPPLGFFLGWKAYRAGKAGNPRRKGLARFISLLPMLAAVAAFVLEFYVMTTMYRA